MTKKGLVVWSVFCVLLFAVMGSGSAGAISLDEALQMAKETVPAYKASELKKRATEALASASLGPYFPSLDASASQNRHSPSIYPDYTSRTYQIGFSYTLFDGGRRGANRDIALTNYDNDSEELRKTLINLDFNVKVAFYTVLARKDSVMQKKLQQKDAQKDFEVAQGRYKHGLVKLSDTLQASVRREQAKFNVITAEGDLRKARAELCSLIGSPLDSDILLEGSLDVTVPSLSSSIMQEAVLQKPEMKQAANAIKLAEFNRSLELSAFWPTISAEASYAKMRGAAPGSTLIPEDRVIGLSLKWNVFELGKLFRQKAAAISTEASAESLNETKRALFLDVQKTHEDLLTAAGKLGVAAEQLKQAEHNYNQALGEYRLGKADILSLVQAESLLADARDQLISIKLNLAVAKSQLEKVIGVPSLDTLRQAGSQGSAQSSAISMKARN